MSLLEKINTYYKIYKEDERNLVIADPSGKKKHVPKTSHPFVLGFGSKAKNQADIDALVSEGKALKTTGIDIYREFFGWDDNRCCQESKGYDLRTQKYINSIKENIGFIDEKHGWDEEKNMTEIFTLKGWLNTSNIDIGKTTEGKWCAQYSIRTDIDDYDVGKLYFNHKPTRTDINTAELISEIELKFFLQDITPVFTCWECGRQVHWLDIEGNLKEKYEHLKEEYCGC
jgi:hypothetical protein